MTNKPDNSIPDAKPVVRPFAPRGRGLVLAGAALFVVSSAFPVLASLSRTESLPPWMGWLDVTLAIALALGMVWVDAIARGRIDDHARQASYRLYRLLAHLLIPLLIVFFVFGDRIKWEILLPGLAWRLWLLVYTLPAGLTLWRMSLPTEAQT